MKQLTVPFCDKNILKNIHAGEIYELSGIIYTARDAAHKRIVELFKKNKTLPFNFKNQFIYYAGPTPAKPGEVIGSVGPTTSCRMDIYAPLLLDLGLGGMIGKGDMSLEVLESIKKNQAIYFCAIGGAGAFLAKKVKSCKIVCFEDLGPEAVYQLEIENFPVVAGIDSYGKKVFKIP